MVCIGYCWAIDLRIMSREVRLLMPKELWACAYDEEILSMTPIKRQTIGPPSRIFFWHLLVTYLTGPRLDRGLPKNIAPTPAVFATFIFFQTTTTAKRAFVLFCCCVRLCCIALHSLLFGSTINRIVPCSLSSFFLRLRTVLHSFAVDWMVVLWVFIRAFIIIWPKYKIHKQSFSASGTCTFIIWSTSGNRIVHTEI